MKQLIVNAIAANPGKSLGEILELVDSQVSEQDWVEAGLGSSPWRATKETLFMMMYAEMIAM